MSHVYLLLSLELALFHMRLKMWELKHFNHPGCHSSAKDLLSLLAFIIPNEAKTAPVRHKATAEAQNFKKPCSLTDLYSRQQTCHSKHKKRECKAPAFSSFERKWLAEAAVAKTNSPSLVRSPTTRLRSHCPHVQFNVWWIGQATDEKDNGFVIGVAVHYFESFWGWRRQLIPKSFGEYKSLGHLTRRDGLLVVQTLERTSGCYFSKINANRAVAG